MGTLHALMTKVGLSDAEDHMVVVSVTLFVTLLCACIVMGHLMEEFHWVSESVTAIILVSLFLATIRHGCSICRNCFACTIIVCVAIALLLEVFCRLFVN